MKTDVVIVGAGPAGIFTAIEMLRKGTKKKIVIVEKGQSVENRHCPKAKTKKCMNCKPYCHITTGFSGAGAFSDGKLSLSYEVAETFRILSEKIWFRKPSTIPTVYILNSAQILRLRASETPKRSERSVPVQFRRD